ncbi:Ribonuclease T2 family protein [Sphingomonas paucimobilis]|nr:Ribonuclease T2 family protein [Sphingomonas paucimobilis]
MPKSLLALLLLAMPVPALAQAAYCSIPQQVPRPRPEPPPKGEPRRLIPAAGYTLALSWSPQYCATARGADSALQCSGRNGRFGFVLHGLWPEGKGRDWPQYCRPADLLPRQIIRQNLCTTPSAQLLQHEWAKHGTCMTTRPELYFNLARAFHDAIHYPNMTLLTRRKSLTVGQFAAEFARANKGLKADMIRVRTTRGDWLSEVWLCMDRAMEYARCPAHQRGAPAGARLRIQPGPNILPVRSRAAPAPRPSLKLDLDPNARVPAD